MVLYKALLATLVIIFGCSFSLHANEENMQSKAYVDSLLEKVKATFEKDLFDRGVVLKVVNSWMKNSISARAYRQNENWFIELTGGMARNPEMTADGYLIVACHEMGHHLAGSPYWGPLSRFSNEGQSDYYATRDCMKRVLQGEDHSKFLEDTFIPSKVRVDCGENFIGSDYLLCLRVAMGALSSVRVQEFRGGLAFKAFFDSPSSKIVASTFNDHNSPQCRLDTLYAGNLCNAPLQNDYSANNCLRSSGFVKSARPLCWFKP